MVSGGVPLLNWKSEQFRLTGEIKEASPRVEVELEESCWQEVESWIRAGTQGELHLELGESLGIFLKVLPQAREVRLLLARPEPERRVATVVLGPFSVVDLVASLERRFVEFHRLGRLHFLSNLEMVWKNKERV